MSKRRSVSNQYRMEVTAKNDCPSCFGTGLAMEQKYNQYSNKIEILIGVCSCVRVLPRLVHDGFEMEDKVTA